MNTFKNRLKAYELLSFSARPLVASETPTSVDLRAGHLLLNRGVACGFGSAVVASVLLAGAESNRILHALHELLTDLVDAAPEEIPDRLRELLDAHAHVTVHLDLSLTALEIAQKAVLVSDGGRTQ